MVNFVRRFKVEFDGGYLNGGCRYYSSLSAAKRSASNYVNQHLYTISNSHCFADVFYLDSYYRCQLVCSFGY